jgi:hypothetical protein
MGNSPFAIVVLAVLAVVALSAHAGQLAPAVQSKVEAALKTVEGWAADPTVVAAVKAHNTTLPADQAAMTQAK